MSIPLTRRQFVKTLTLGASALGYWGLTGCSPVGGTHDRRNMCGFAAPALDRVRVGIVGLGMRGPGAVERLGKMKDVDIAALCDIRPERVTFSQDILARQGRPPAREFTAGPEDWRNLCQLDLDLVYIATPWEWHVPMATGAMRNGKHAAVEVPASTDLDGCWDLVETSESTGKHCMMLENCCYDYTEMVILNMVRHGLFGELLHAEGGYLHDLRGLKMSPSYYQGAWRIKYSITHNANLYPTHGLGPIAQWLDINRGDAFDFLVSMSCNSRGLHEYAVEKFGPNDPRSKQKYALGDINSTLIRTKLGRTIILKHDTNLPRPYSRGILLQGTKGIVRKYPEEKIYLEGAWKGEAWHKLDEYKKKYEP